VVVFAFFWLGSRNAGPDSLSSAQAPETNDAPRVAPQEPQLSVAAPLPPAFRQERERVTRESLDTKPQSKSAPPASARTANAAASAPKAVTSSRLVLDPDF
jgi:hypothetical protein